MVTLTYGLFQSQRCLLHSCPSFSVFWVFLACTVLSTVCKSFNTVSSHLKCSFDRIKNNDCARKIVATCLDQWERSLFVFRTILRHFSPPPKAWQRVVLPPNNVQMYVYICISLHTTIGRNEKSNTCISLWVCVLVIFPVCFCHPVVVLLFLVLFMYIPHEPNSTCGLYVLLRSVKRFTTGHQRSEWWSRSVTSSKARHAINSKIISTQDVR